MRDGVLTQVSQPVRSYMDSILIGLRQGLHHIRIPHIR